MVIAAVLLVLVVLSGLAIGREIVRSNYYVTEHDGTVSIMQGVQGSFLGLALQEPYLLGCLNARNELSLIRAGQSTDNLDCRMLGVNDMRPSERAQVVAGLPSGTLDEAISQIEELARSSVLPTCAARTPTPTTTTTSPLADTAYTGNTCESGHSRRRHRNSCAGDPDHGDRSGSGAPGCAGPSCPAAFAVPNAAAHRDGAASPTAGAGNELPGSVMTTQPQSPVTVMPPLPNRRNSELFLLGFAAVITTVALLLVEANQEQGLHWDLAQYTVAYLALFTGAHLAVRRFTPYADPLLLPVVALLNGLGLVMIHRLDLAAGGPLAKGLGGTANQQMLWTLFGVVVFSLVVIFLRDHRVLARYGYVCGLTGLILLAIPAVLPRSVSEQNGAKIWIELPGFSIQPAEFSKILLLIFFAAVLVSKRSVFTSAGKHFVGMDLPRPRDLAPLLAAWIASVGVMVFEKDLGTSLLLYASFLVMVYIATDRLSWVVIGLALFAAGSVAAYYVFDHVQVRVQTWLGPVRRSRRRRLSDGAVAVQLRHRRHLRHRSWQRSARYRARRIDRLHHRRDWRRAGAGRFGRGTDALHHRHHPRPAHGDRGAGQLRKAAGRRAGVDVGDPVVHRGWRRHQADPADRTHHAVVVVRRFVAAGQLRAAGDPRAHLARRTTPDRYPAADHAYRGREH